MFWKKEKPPLINAFEISEDETFRINEALICRNKTADDIVSITWNTERKIYVVFFRDT